MAQNITYPHFDVEVDPDKVETDFLLILQQIRSNWKDADIVFERSPLTISRGIINTMVKCYNKNEPMDAIMIRIHNPSNFNNLIDRSTEVKCIKELHQKGCAPKLLATVKNGFCYEYIHGEVLDHMRLREEPIWQLIAKDIAKFHSASIEGQSLTKSNSLMDDFLTKLWQSYPTELADPVKNEIFKKEFPPKEELKAESDTLYNYAKSFNSPIVLCHNDNRAENIIWNPENQTIHFVDFEAMNYNYQAMELASHFQRFCGLVPPDYSLMPSKEFQMKWLRVYLEHYYKNIGNNKDVKEIDVRRLYVQVAKFHLFLLHNAVMAGPAFEAMNIINSNVKFDMLGFSLVSLKEFYRDKDRLMSLEMP